MVELSVKLFESAPKVPLGELIEARNERNSDLRYGVDLIEGVTSEGFFAPTKAVTEGINLKPYKAVRKGDFVYNPSRLNIGSLAYRDTENMCIVSHLYVVFHIKEDKVNVVLPEYMLMFFRRDEFKRTIDIHNFGSQRAEFNIYQLGEIEIPLPSIEVQREYVAAYKALQQLAEQNEALAEPLQKACHAFISSMKSQYQGVNLGQLIRKRKEKNKDNLDLPALGVSREGFIPPKQKEADRTKYSIFYKNDFVFNPARMEVNSIALNTKYERAICSALYEVFYVDDGGIMPEYLNAFVKRDEFARQCEYLGTGTAREICRIDTLAEIKIPLPPIEVQRSIVALYHCAEEARTIAREAREQLKKLAPAMVQRAANTPVEV